MNYHSVSWKQLHSLTYKLAIKISDDSKKIDLIVGVARGGLTISHIVSDFLQLPVASFTISSYKDLQQQELSDISYHVGGSLKNKHVLLIDDISDTGKTFIRGTKYINDLGASAITTASIFIKSWSLYIPQYHVKQMDKWIILPYEMRETVYSIQTNLLKEGKSTEEISKQLSLVKIPNQYIKKYMKKS